MSEIRVPASKRPHRGLPQATAGSRPRPRAAANGSGGGEFPFERNLHAYLANQLGREIVGGVYPPGSLLPHEFEMCTRFAVSRTALREAYSVLTAKALIVARPKVGTRVRPKADWNMLDPDVLAWHLQTVPTENFVADLYVLREMVEPAAAALAATGRAPATIDRIAAAYADMERFKDGTGDLIAADLQFHLAILEATGNHFIGALGSLIHAALVGTFKLSWEGAARMQDDRLHQHRAIFEAIRDGKPESARTRMTELLRESMNDVRKFLRRRKTTSRADKVLISAKYGRLDSPHQTE
jgi:GntR family galactonate operon transcriptional repressor